MEQWGLETLPAVWSRIGVTEPISVLIRVSLKVGPYSKPFCKLYRTLTARFGKGPMIKYVDCHRALARQHEGRV